MSFQKSDRVEEAYSRFGRDHQSLCQELLARVRQEALPTKYDAYGDASPRGLLLKKWFLIPAVGLAAMLLVCIGAARLLAPADPSARASLISSQIRIVKSVCIPGWYDDSQDRHTQ
jgi:hypothetical protein